MCEPSTSADAATKRRDHRPDFVAAEHLVEAGFFDIQNLALDRKNGLEAAIAPLFCRASGRLAFHDVELAVGRVALLAVGELAGQPTAFQRTLAPHQVARLARGFARARRVDGLAENPLGNRRILLEERPEPVVDNRLDDALHFRVAQLGLRLTLELRPRNLHADDRRQAFADVVAADAFLQIFREVVFPCVEVDRSRQRRPEARQVRPAFMRVDVVGEGIDRLGVAVIPLQRDFYVNAVALALHVNRLLVDGCLVLVQVLDERDDAAVVLELMALGLTLVVQRDENAGVQERELAQPLRQGVEAEVGGLEDFSIGTEGDLRAALLRGPRDLEIAGGLAALIFLLVHLAVAPDFQVQLLRERIDHRDAHAVETAGNLVALVVELTAGVQHREHNFGCRPAVRHVVDRDAPAVVDHGNRIVNVDRDVDLVAEAGQRLVYGVVDDLVDKVVQPGRTRGADVHGRPHADGLQALEHLDFVGTVVRIRPELGARLVDCHALVYFRQIVCLFALPTALTRVRLSWA